MHYILTYLAIVLLGFAFALSIVQHNRIAVIILEMIEHTVYVMLWVIVLLVFIKTLQIVQHLP